jgi:hypothetical protein
MMRLYFLSSVVDPVYEIQLGDLCFVYNCVPSRNPPPLEVQVGQGLACVSVSLFDTTSSKSVGRIPVSRPYDSTASVQIVIEVSK